MVSFNQYKYPKIIFSFLLLLPIFSLSQISQQKNNAEAKSDLISAIIKCESISKPKSKCSAASRVPDTYLQNSNTKDESFILNVKLGSKAGIDSNFEKSASTHITAPVTVVSLDQLNQISKNFFKDKVGRYGLTDNPYLRQSVCAQRSLLLAHDLEKDLDIKSIKIFAVGNMGKIKEKMGYEYNWNKYHVANIVYAKTSDGKIKPYVLDRILSDNPIPLESWQAQVSTNNKSIDFYLTDPKVKTPSTINKILPTKFDTYWAEQNIEKAAVSSARRKSLDLEW